MERNIFIGLGGSGVNTVAKLKYKIYANLSGADAYEQLMQNYKFLFVDTDEADVKKMNEHYKSQFEGGRRQFIDPASELVNLGLVNPRSVYEGARGKAPENRTGIDNTLLEACPETMAGQLRAYPLSAGAGAFRYNSHVAFACKAAEFVSKLKAGINQLSDTRTAGSEGVMLRYWVVSSSNGGTGSGTFNDVLYLVNMCHKNLHPGEEPKVTLVLYMPGQYIDSNKGDEKYLCNAQAVFLETDGYQCMGRSGNADYQEKMHRMLFRPDNLQVVKGTAYQPFSSCIPIDIRTENGNSLVSLQAMYSNTAELLFFIHQSQGDPLASSFKSDADNHLEDVVRENALNYLQPMGYVALRKPESEFDNYMEHRLKTEVLEYGLLSPFPEELNLESEVTGLYDSVIRKALFSNEPDTFSSVVQGIVDNQIRRSFSDSLLKEDDKPRKKLTSGISQPAADQVVKNINMALDDLCDGRTVGSNGADEGYSSRGVLKQIEETLWSWVETMTLRYGLEYVKLVLDGLDNYATQQLMAYTTGQGAEGVSALSESVKNISEQLPELRRQAEEVTIREFVLGGNENDVRRYYNQLLSYIKAKTALALSEKKYDLLAALCKGDNGIIDRIRFHVGDLLKTAREQAESPKRAYLGLAKHFENSASDITTVYLPEISGFVKNGAWDPDNMFSRLYAKVLRPGKRMIPGHGFAPVRTQQEDQKHSVEGFLYHTIEQNKKEMIAEGYYVDDKENSRSVLFGKNRYSDNPAKVIEDLLTFVEKTYDKDYRPALNADWYGLTLEELFMRLTEDERTQIRRRLYPQLFYSYFTNVIGNGRDFCYVIAPTQQMATNVFNYQSGSTDWRYDRSSSTSVAYMLRAKIGLSLKSYALYNTVRQTYERTLDKSRYHTHVAWSESNGDYRKLDIRQSPGRELIVFTKYLLLDEYARQLTDLFYRPDKESEKAYYRQTPCLIWEDSISFASEKSVKVVDGYLALNCEGDTFDEYTAASSDLLYSSVFDKFEENFVANRHLPAIKTLESYLAESEVIRRRYNSVKTALEARLDQLYTDSRRDEEKKFLRSVMHLLASEGELSDYAKFIG